MNLFNDNYGDDDDQDKKGPDGASADHHEEQSPQSMGGLLFMMTAVFLRRWTVIRWPKMKSITVILQLRAKVSRPGSSVSAGRKIRYLRLCSRCCGH